MPRCRRSLLLLLVLVLGGCSFDLSRPPPDSRAHADLLSVDRALDRSPLAERPADLLVPDRSCVVQTETLSAEADTILITNDNLAKGALTAGHIGSKLQSRGLFRFSWPPAATKLRALRLRLSPVEKDDNCGPPACKSCDGIQKPGALDLHYMVSDWTEATATWTKKDFPDGAAWQQDGAEGSNDRGVLVASSSFTLGQEVLFEIVKTDLLSQVAAWSTTGKLSLQILPRDGTALVTAMREQALHGCAPAKPAPRLEVDYCQ